MCYSLPRSDVLGVQPQGAQGLNRQAVRPNQDMVQKATAQATTASALAEPLAVNSQIGLRARDSNTAGDRGSRSLRTRDPNPGAVVEGRNLRPRDPNTRTVVRQAREALPVQSLSNLLASRSENSARPTRRSVSAVAAPPSPPLRDIDEADHGNWMYETKYVNDIYAYYKKVEHLYHVLPEYMEEQADINERMRAILIDWLVEVHLKFKLMPETLFLTVQIIDRYLAIDTVSRRNLQLVGVTAMLIASKYEEIWAPEVRDFVFICDRAYTRDQILGMEKVMLNKLQFKVTSPTSYHFLARFIKACGPTEKKFNMLCMYAIEIAFPEYKMLKYNYSKLSAAAVLVARERMGTGPWTAELQHHTGYTEKELRECANTMEELMTAAGKTGVSLRAVHKKYSNPRFFEVALLFPPNPQ
jgi:cyclin B